MTVMQSRDTRSFVSGADLSTHQFKFVKMGTDQKVTLAAANGADVVGILINSPKADEVATVVMTGRVMVEAGSTIAVGARVMTDSTGRAKTYSSTPASGATHHEMGLAIDGATVGQMMAIELYQGGRQHSTA